MQREFTAIPSNWSVGQTIDYLRENKDLPEEFLEIFIINEEFKPIGTVPSSRVLSDGRQEHGRYDRDGRRRCLLEYDSLVFK